MSTMDYGVFFCVKKIRGALHQKLKKMTIIDSAYFKEYRQRLWFTQAWTKTFFAAKDIHPTVDYNYIELLNTRLVDIINKINWIVSDKIKSQNIKEFCDNNIFGVYNRLKENDIIPKLNNQWRRIEEVYFSWMRWYVISSFFTKALWIIFNIGINDINLIWDDDLINIENFKRTPKADLEIHLQDWSLIRIEVQSWFQWTNDIKQHKVLEAKRVRLELWVSSMVVHFDLFNWQVAFVKVDDIEDNSINRITRQQMEWQTVFNIDQNYFMRKLIDNPPSFEKIFEEFSILQNC